MPMELIRGMAELKRAAARANAKLGVLDGRKADAIAEVCGEYNMEEDKRMRQNILGL